MIDISEFTLRAVLTSLGRPKPRMLRRLRGGVVNPAFSVDDEWMIRFNTRDRDQKKFLREKLCYDLLQGARTPKALYYFDRHTNFDGEILVTEKLRGRRVSDDWPRMPECLRQKLVHEAAGGLRRIQSLKLQKFGSIENPRAQFNTWPEAVAHELDKVLRLSFQTKVMTEKDHEAVLRAFENCKSDLAVVSEAQLVHGDFHFGNVLWNEDHISGFIDFEWAVAGDPLVDFRNKTNLHDSAHGCSDLFEAEYMRLHGNVDLRTPRLSFYRLLNKLELLSISTRHWLGKVSWAEANHARIEKSFTATLAELS